MKRIYAFLIFFLFTLVLTPVFAKLPARTIEITPPPAQSLVLAADPPKTQNLATTGQPRHYTQDEIDQMLAGTKNSYDLKKLIQCESQNTNIARMDSNGKISFGLLQFNGTGTWSQFAPLAGVSGTAMNPIAAIKVADWMISNGFGHRWTCWKIQNLF